MKPKSSTNCTADSMEKTEEENPPVWRGEPRGNTWHRGAGSSSRFVLLLCLPLPLSLFLSLSLSLSPSLFLSLSPAPVLLTAQHGSDGDGEQRDGSSCASVPFLTQRVPPVPLVPGAAPPRGRSLPYPSRPVPPSRWRRGVEGSGAAGAAGSAA